MSFTFPTDTSISPHFHLLFDNLELKITVQTFTWVGWHKSHKQLYDKYNQFTYLKWFVLYITEPKSRAWAEKNGMRSNQCCFLTLWPLRSLCHSSSVHRGKSFGCKWLFCYYKDFKKTLYRVLRASLHMHGRKHGVI